jgi:hypothetical protein
MSSSLVIHTGLIGRFSESIKFWYLLRVSDTKGTGVVKLVDALASLTNQGFSTRQVKTGLSYLVKHNFITKTVDTLYLTSPHKILSKNNIHGSIRALIPTNEIDQLKITATVIIAQVLQTKAEMKSKLENNRSNSFLGSEEIIDRIQFVTDETGKTESEVIEDRHYLPNFIGNRVLGYAASKKIMILPQGVAFGVGSYEKIASMMQCSVRTICQRLKNTPKIRIGVWEPGLNILNLNDIENPGRYFKFKRQSGTLVVRMCCNMFIHIPYQIISSKSELKRSKAESKMIKHHL